MRPLLNIFYAYSFASLFIFSAVGAPQECVSYKIIPRTAFKKQVVSKSALVNDTVMRNQPVTTFKPIWTTETRYRTTTTLKPITTTSQREERFLVRRPIVETTFRVRQIEETSYETVTEQREQRYLVETPVVETQMREENIVVRKPITTTTMTTENVTTYKPITTNETQYIGGALLQNELAFAPSRRRLRWLRPGHYVDPVTGNVAFKSRGLHWDQQSSLRLETTVQPALIPQQVQRTTYVPQTLSVQKPVTVTEYVDQVETRRVPVNVRTTSKKIQVVKIPVTVSKPVTKVRTERIPVQETKYREEVYVRKIPTTTTTYKKIESNEPYEVQICKWVAETKAIRVPETVTRRVDYDVECLTPVTEWIRVPVDVWGNILGPGKIVATTADNSNPYSRLNRIPVQNSILESQTSSIAQSTTNSAPTWKLYRGNFEVNDGDSEKPDSVLIPETDSTPTSPETEMTVVSKRPATSAPEKPAKDKSRLLDLPTIDRPELPDESESELDLRSNSSADLNVRPGDSTEEPDELELNEIE